MRNTLLVATVATVALIQGLPALQQQGQTGTAAVSGQVLDFATGLPIPQATVTIMRAGSTTAERSLTSDSRGRFVAMGLPSQARYSLEAHRWGFAPAVWGQQTAQSLADTPNPSIVLAEGEWRRDLEIRMLRLGSITGRVLDEHGEPLVGVPVRAFSVIEVGGKPYSVSAEIAATNDLGIYRLANLLPGDYRVAVVNSQATVPESLPEVDQRRPVGALITGGPPDRGPASVSSPTLSASLGFRLVVNPLTTTPESDGSARTYLPVFFPNSPSPQGGQPVAVSPGTTKSGVDFFLRPVPAFRVAGRMSALPEGELPFLRLLPAGAEDLGLGNEIATTQVRADGSFAFFGVPSGDYTVVMNGTQMEFALVGGAGTRLPVPPGFPDAVTGSVVVAGTPVKGITRTSRPSTQWMREPLSVAGNDINGLVLTVQRTFGIEGRIELEPDTKARPGLRGLAVIAEPANRDPALGASSTYIDKISFPAAFKIDGLIPGNYLLRSSVFAVKHVTWLGRDVTDSGLDLTSGGADQVVVTLTDRTALVRGSIAGLSEQRRAAVIAFPAERELRSRYGWTPRKFQVALAQEGKYSIALTAGDYLLVAVDERDASRWTDPLFLQSLASNAAKISVTWGARLDQDLVFRSLNPK